jgi:hypothetical protein
MAIYLASLSSQRLCGGSIVLMRRVRHKEISRYSNDHSPLLAGPPTSAYLGPINVRIMVLLYPVEWEDNARVKNGEDWSAIIKDRLRPDLRTIEV